MSNFSHQFPLVSNSYNMPSTINNMHSMEQEPMITSTISCNPSVINNGDFLNVAMLDEIHEFEHLNCSIGGEVAFNYNEARLRENNMRGELTSIVSQELKHIGQVSKVERKWKNIEFKDGEGKRGKKLKQARADGKRQKKVPETAQYVQVRARRGEATDSHSLAERARREKISARFKLLQSLVPGCDKITGKARILDAVINYLQSLQYQVQILAGELSSASFMVDNNGEEFSTNPFSTMVQSTLD